MKFVLKNKNFGFTLVELMAVIFMIVLVSLLVTLDFRQSRAQYDLIQTGQMIVSDFRRAQDMAINVKEIEGVIYEAYGLRFNQNTNPNGYELVGFDGSSWKKIEKADFPYALVELDDQPNQIVAFHTSLGQVVGEEGTNSATTEQEIIIKIRNTNIQRRIVVYPGGLISAEN